MSSEEEQLNCPDNGSIPDNVEVHKKCLANILMLTNNRNNN